LGTSAAQAHAIGCRVSWYYGLVDLRWKNALIPLALAVAAFGQTQQSAGPSPDKEAPESAEHKYARQQLEPAAKLMVALGQQATAVNKQEDKDCGPVNLRTVAYDSNGQSFPAPPREKKESRADYEVRKNACLAAFRQLQNTPALFAALDAAIQNDKALQFKLDHADDCAAIYQKTIDEKAADTTTRESEQIKACRSADLYPPRK
jgi:hypothetical protein